MNSQQISSYLERFRGTELKSAIMEELSNLKRTAVWQGDQKEAKRIWCLEQVFKVINHYLTAYRYLLNSDYFKAWCELDRADIELYFLHAHLDYSENKYNLEFIEKNINQLQKLFPYEYFASRESTINKWSCSICNQVITPRNSCSHEVGEIYNGEMCSRVAGDIEFHGIAIVKNPFDKYTVLFPEGKEYNYSMLENLMKNWTSPYDKWELQIRRDLNDEYKELGRNEPCLCKSGKKYKRCCLITGKDRHDHFKLFFLKKDPKKLNLGEKLKFNTWKN